MYETNDSGSNFSRHDINQHKLAANTFGCRGCHAGLEDQDGLASVNGSPGNIHGGNFTWPAGSKTPTIVVGRSFLYGGWLSGSDTSTMSCYGGNCNHTSSAQSWP